MTIHNTVDTPQWYTTINAYGHHGIVKHHNALTINRGECTRSTLITRHPYRRPDYGFP